MFCFFYTSEARLLPVQVATGVKCVWCVRLCVCVVGAFSTDILKQYKKEECTNPRTLGWAPSL